jgi:mannose-6-phosphate isomerase-like protein (cupin superfamily)
MEIVERPWGRYEVILEDSGYKVKRITVEPGGRLSLQSHNHRSEHWVVVSSIAKITINETVQRLEAGKSAYIPLGSKHRLENEEKKPMALIEVQFGDYLGEDDIKRYEDIYGR